MERLRCRNVPTPGVGQYDPKPVQPNRAFRLSASKKSLTDTDLAIKRAKEMPGPADFAAINDGRSLRNQTRGATLNTSGRGWEVQHFGANYMSPKMLDLARKYPM